VEALQAWLGEHGCEVKDIQKGTLRHALRRQGLDPVVRRVIELRISAAHAAAAKIDTLLAWRHADGRVRGTLRFHGAGTGRWTGHGPQPQNFKRDSDGIDTKIAAIMDGGAGLASPLEAVGDIARAMICAAPGHRLLIGDFSGVESRVTAWVSGQQSKLEQWAMFDLTGNPEDEPYYILGRQCGQPVETARPTGKTADLAFGYMGGPGAWDKLAPENDTTSEAGKRRYQQTWRSAHPQTVAFWHGIDRTAIAAVRNPNSTFPYKRFKLSYDGTFLRIVLPSGRALSYPYPRLGKGKFGHAMILFKDNAGGKWTDCRFGQGAYGGLWIENIVQAVSRDLLAAAMLRLEAAGYQITLTVHDEIMCEAPNGFGSIEEFQRLITTLPEWADGLPIAIKARNGQRFSKSTENVHAVDGNPEIPILCETRSDASSGSPEITNPRPSVAVEPEAEATPDKQNAGARHDALAAILGLGFDGEGDVSSLHANHDQDDSANDDESAAGGANQQTNNNNSASNYHDGGADKDTDKPYPPVRAALLAKGYRDVPGLHLWKNLGRAGDPPHGWDNKNWVEQGGNPAKLLEICREVPADGTRLVYINTSQWDFEPTPEQEWAVYNRIPLRQCVLFSGEGATGKSTEQLHLTAATALNRDWLGAMPEQGPAIFIDAEDDDKVIHRRLKAIAAHYDTNITTMIDHGLRLVSWVGCDATLAVASRNGKIEPTSLYKQLLEEAGDIKPKMIGIAASANVFAGSENDRAQVQQFVGLLTRIAMVANGAVVLISHPSLTGISTESGLSGTTQWHNSVRARFYLRGVKPTADEPLDTDLREIVFKKNNYGPLSESITLRWNAGLFLPVGGVDLDQTAREEIAQEVFLSLLKRFHKANRNVSANRSVIYAPALFVNEDEAKRAGLTSKNLETAMRQLFRDQKIINEQYGKPSNPHYRLVIKP